MGATTGNSPTIYARGSVANVGLIPMPQGSGNVGIGTASPTANLNIYNAIQPNLLRQTGLQYSSLSFGNTTHTSVFAITHDIYNDVATFSFYGVEKMRFTSSGFVGIGTTSPAYTLQVAGSVAGSSAYVNTSDARLKKDVQPIAYGLEKPRIRKS